MLNTKDLEKKERWSVTEAEVWDQKAEAVRRFLAGLDRKELLAVRQDVDWMLGYREFQSKVRLEGIVL